MWNLSGAWWGAQVWFSLFQAAHQYLHLPWTLADGSSDGRVWPHFSSKGFPACFCLFFCFSHTNFVFIINLFSSRREKKSFWYFYTDHIKFINSLWRTVFSVRFSSPEAWYFFPSKSTWVSLRYI